MSFQLFNQYDIMKRNKQLSTFTKAEEEIIQMMCQREHCPVRDIIDQPGNPEIPHSTVSSVVRILEMKGFVGHKAFGKTYEQGRLCTERRKKPVRKTLRGIAPIACQLPGTERGHEPERTG